MSRRVVTHHGRTKDNEDLTIITVYEPGVSRKEIKKLSPYCKNHEVLIFNGQSYDFKRKNA